MSLSPPPDTASLIERANRMLDGMTVNRDAFARDVKAAAQELDRWRQAHARTAAADPRGKAGFFDDLFGAQRS